MRVPRFQGAAADRSLAHPTFPFVAAQKGNQLKRKLRLLQLVFSGVWVVNILLLMARLTNPPLYEALSKAGVQMFSCIDWDAAGRQIPGVCSTPPPMIDPETGAISEW